MSNDAESLTSSEKIENLEGFVGVLRKLQAPMLSVTVVKNLEGPELSGFYKNEGVNVLESVELASAQEGNEITYLLLGLGALGSDFPTGITILEGEI